MPLTGSNLPHSVVEEGIIHRVFPCPLILQMFAEDKCLSIGRLCEKTGLSSTTAKREIAFLKKSGYLERIGSLKTGYWKVNSRFTRSVSGSDV